MDELHNMVKLESGVSQFRIKEAERNDAPVFNLYEQAELEDDLSGIRTSKDPKKIRTNDRVSILKEGDVVFGLISGKCAIVKPWHSGYLFSQNYVRLSPLPSVDPHFLAFLLNENDVIKLQLHVGRQGSSVKMHTVKQLANLQMPDLPPLDTQKIIGCLYFNQLELTAHKKRHADSETIFMIEKLKEASRR